MIIIIIRNIPKQLQNSVCHGHTYALMVHVTRFMLIFIIFFHFQKAEVVVKLISCKMSLLLYH